MAETTFKADSYSKELQVYVNMERAGVSLINSVGRLQFEKSIELVLFRNHLLDTKVTEVLRLHKYAAEVVERPISIFDTSELAVEICDMNLAPAKIDIGRLAAEWLSERDLFESKRDFLMAKLGTYTLTENDPFQPRDVVLFGFGRIGRLAARELIKQAGKGQQLRLRAIVARKVDDITLKKRAQLLENDSVHGTFAGTIDIDYDTKSLIVNGQRIYFIDASDPGNIDYTAYGIKNALVIDNTGVFKDKIALSQHLNSKGVSRVLLTAPGREIPNVVYGINHIDLDLENDKIYSAASCTTNAISPVLKVVEEAFGVERGHIETVHAYTNDQNLLDNMHKNARRGRSAAINMVITETGAGKAVTKVMPVFKDKLTANAVRVPTPNGSLAVLSLTLQKNTTKEEMNSLLKRAALNGDLVNQIYYSINEELVSSDIIGNDCCAVFDSHATIVSNDGKSCVLYVWYDNEFGYTKQVIRLAKYVCKVRRNIYY